MLNISEITTEYQKDPIGLDVKRPAFSYKLESDQNNVRQKNCQIIVKDEDRVVYDSGIMETEDSLHHVYAGEDLEKENRYDVFITVEDDKGETAHGKAFFETGLLSGENFEAEFISHDLSENEEACVVYFKDFSLTKKVRKARAYISALGIYSAKLNGERISDLYFAPGWTSYQERLQYQTYDISDLLKEKNRIEITVADGWYKGILGFYGQGNHYGKKTAVIAQLSIEYEDGTKETVGTDLSWSYRTSIHRYAQIYHGEVIDLSFRDETKNAVIMSDYAKSRLIAQENEPIRITEELKVKEVLKSPSNKTILDFGQNMTGMICLKTKQEKGTKIILRHGEMLEDGELFTTNLRTARATDTFICSGEEDEFLPEFTFHGFRYVEVEGLEDVEPSQFTAMVMHSDFRRNSHFECDNELIDQLHRNIDWTFRSNYFDVPMDCPQRDERLGYTGDAQIFLPTALFHGELALFYRKWLNDLKVEQTDEFGVPLTVPDILRTRVCVNIWHDAATIVPWMVYQTYGDLRLLMDQYDSMKAAVEYSRRSAGHAGLLRVDNSAQFGDWVALDGPKGPYRKPEKVLHPSQDEKIGGTDPYLIANVYYLNSIDIVSKTAALLGHKEDEERYLKLYDEVRRKFREEYLSVSGRIAGETQTAAALILHFGLADERQEKTILERLKLNLIKTNKHLRTGFVGTQYLPGVLSDHGLHQLAGDILMKDDCPSWLYEVKLGATTVWELWDGVNPDHSINPFVMNSFNQYGFASIGGWLIRKMCGIDAVEPGYRKSVISPRLVKGITSFDASYETPYGRLACCFSCKDGRINADIEIPVNTSCEVDLPEKEKKTLGSGKYHFEYDSDLSFEYEPYSEDSSLKVLLMDPDAKAYFEEKAPELKGNALVKNFASRMSIAEIKATLPQTMIPASAYPVFDGMIALLNRKAKQ